MSLISRGLASLSLHPSELNGGFSRRLSSPAPADGGQSFGGAIRPAQAPRRSRRSVVLRAGAWVTASRLHGKSASLLTHCCLLSAGPLRVTGVPAVLPSPSSRHVCPLPRGCADPPGPRRDLPGASLSSPTLGAVPAGFPPVPLVLSEGGSAMWPEGGFTSALLRNQGAGTPRSLAARPAHTAEVGGEGS